MKSTQVLVVSTSTCFSFHRYFLILKKPTNIFLAAALLSIAAALVLHDFSEVAGPAGSRAADNQRYFGSPAAASSLGIETSVLQPATGITSNDPVVSADRSARATGLSCSDPLVSQSSDLDPRMTSRPGQPPAATTGPARAAASVTPDPVDRSDVAPPLRLTVNRPASQPVAIIDIGDPQVSDATATARIDAIARDFADSLKASGLAPSDPAYRRLWDQELVKADTRFRSMYGGHAWLRHHIQLHQSTASQSNGN